MKKIFYLGFCVALAAGIGCAISDYQIITDNDQAFSGQQAANFTVNTNGKAHIRSFQIALIFADRTEEAINFVDQKSNGDRTLTTYSNHSTIGVGGPTFHDDLYCNPDWTGCAVWTSHDPPGGFDRTGAGFAAFDGRFNVNCAGAGISQIFATTRNFRGNYNDGECGRGSVESVQRMITLMNMADVRKFGDESWLFYQSDGTNTNYIINGEQGMTVIPVASRDIYLSPNSRRAALISTNPRLATQMRAVDAVTEVGSAYDFQIIYNGLEWNRTFHKGQSMRKRALERF